MHRLPTVLISHREFTSEYEYHKLYHHMLITATAKRASMMAAEANVTAWMAKDPRHGQV